MTGADPRLLGALRVSGGGLEGERMGHICPRFTPSRISLTESARETVSLLRLFFFFFFVSCKRL